MTEDLPLCDYGMIGNGRAAALVSRDGSIDWCCFPRFDSAAVFYRLLDAKHGAYLAVRPVGDATVRRTYVEGTNVLRTSWHNVRGQLQITDFIPLPEEEAGEIGDLDCARIIRRVEVLEGEVEVQVKFRPGFGYGRVHPEVMLEAEGCRGRAGDEQFVLGCPAPLSESRPLLFESRIVMQAGESRWLSYCYSEGQEVPFLRENYCERALEKTVAGWRRWIGRCAMRGASPRRYSVVRSF